MRVVDVPFEPPPGHHFEPSAFEDRRGQGAVVTVGGTQVEGTIVDVAVAPDGMLVTFRVEIVDLTDCDEFLRSLEAE